MIAAGVLLFSQFPPEGSRLLEGDEDENDPSGGTQTETETEPDSETVVPISRNGACASRNQDGELQV